MAQADEEEAPQTDEEADPADVDSASERRRLPPIQVSKALEKQFVAFERHRVERRGTCSC